MPEATVLYTVTAVVVLGLFVWVAVVLKTAREPWARPRLPRQSGIEGLAAGAEAERQGQGGGEELSRRAEAEAAGEGSASATSDEPAKGDAKA